MIDENYIYPFISDEDAITIIKDKIKTNTPFAFTRFGDGEIHFINGTGYEAFEKTNCKLWGYNYPNEVFDLYTDARKIILKALEQSDIIGIMEKDPPNLSINYKAKDWSIKKEVLLSYNINPDKLNIATHQLSRQPCLGSPEGFKDVLQGKSVNIVSPYVVRLKERNLSKLFGAEVNYTEHPLNVNFNNREDFLKTFAEIKEDVVALGIGLQKDYGVILRDEFGKIAIDMGATVDAWSGIASRHGFGKGGRQQYLLIK